MQRALTQAAGGASHTVVHAGGRATTTIASAAVADFTRRFVGTASTSPSSATRPPALAGVRTQLRSRASSNAPIRVTRRWFSAGSDASGTRVASAASASTSSPGGGTLTHGTRTVEINRPLQLARGGVLPSLSINYFDSAWFDPMASCKPIVYIMPSMSHSALICRAPTARGPGQPAGWWEEVVGFGAGAGVDLRHFRVISASPLGGPYGTTSPLSIDPRTGRQYRANFPLITPLDQARVHSYLLDHLGVKQVHAIVGASMGGMQALQFAVHFPTRYERVIAICTTGQTSSSTQALRGVQRAAVRMDPFFANGDYADAPGSASVGPVAGMGIARMFGTICYRSREEFDARFSNRPLAPPATVAATTAAAVPAPVVASPSSSSPTAHPPLFEVEKYLHHQASTFTGRYDANCYLTLSQCMDLMDLAVTTPVPTATAANSTAASGASSAAVTPAALSYEAACGLVPASKQWMLLPIASDALIPPAEMERLASVLGSRGSRVHCERVHSLFGHDAFLKEVSTFNPRFAEFLSVESTDGVERVRAYVNSLFDL